MSVEDDQPFRFGQVHRAKRHLLQRKMKAVRKEDALPLPALAHINERRCLTGIEPREEIGHADFPAPPAYGASMEVLSLVGNLSGTGIVTFPVAAHSQARRTIV